MIATNEKSTISTEYMEFIHKILSDKDAVFEALENNNEALLTFEIEYGMECDLWVYRQSPVSVTYQFFFAGIAEVSGLVTYTESD